ncbi:hypothetical protein AB0M43_37745 [Longispora sp. NPDC051575]|uniref:hypothetical protein n=1 Tax=Longispora sp. NPDC051575 TaxID=3154943 RepID=UPI003417EEFD
MRRLLAVFLALLALTGCARIGPSPAPTHSGTAAPTRSVGPVISVDPAATQVALAFADAWVNTAVPAEQWRAGVQKLATPGYAALLGTVDPARVPASRITGSPTVVSSDSVSTAVRVPTDAGPVLVVVTRASGTWLVATVQRDGVA